MPRLGPRRPGLLVTLLAGGIAAGLTLTALPGSAVDAPGTQRTDTLFPGQGNTGYDVQHYDVRLSYVPATDRVSAQVTLTARSRARLDSFHLDYDGPRLTGVTVDGRRAMVRRSGTELVVTPARPVASGHRFTARVSYAGTPQRLQDQDGSFEGWLRTGDGAITLNEPIGALTWLPSNNTPADKATYRFTLSTPRGYRAVANGALVSERVGETRTTSVWSVREPMATYLATVGFGRYRVTTGTYRSVDGRSIPLRSYVDAGETPGSTTRLPEVLSTLEGWFGPYPFASAGSVVDDADVDYALETQTRPFYPPGFADVLTVVHETAHQWFGDSLTVRDWHDLWLAEGFATYAEWLWTGSHGGRTPQQEFDRRYAKPADDPLWSPAPRRFTEPGQLFGDPVYQRGAMTLQALRTRIGDADFAALLKAWPRERRHGSVTTAQFERLAERISGQDLTTLFRDWLDTDGRPSGY
ncbi:M1 family metallopeptidase [Nocardioides sp. TRM66260-LWL]|uniref:M1 family metallopeptidase n=1 Tax=Nocardioides sp. TRM66260-LWL TaxID=2874478 RepID=UPI001CC5A03A|nr:M1 family metallopeptidase [Nocardioides sp. TRM66260-LWL]MBZ5735395.1 M1 family metallopeptidase [Nocardioides sp. TRM66260-LWL]